MINISVFFFEVRTNKARITDQSDSKLVMMYKYLVQFVNNIYFSLV